MTKASKSSIKRLELTTFKLRSLLNITQAINENLTQEQLLSRYEELLTKDLSIGKVLVFKYEDSWECILKSGEVGATDENIDVEKDLLPIDEISFVTSSTSTSLNDFDIVIPVINKGTPVAFVIIGDIGIGNCVVLGTEEAYTVIAI